MATFAHDMPACLSPSLQSVDTDFDGVELGRASSTLPIEASPDQREMEIDVSFRERALLVREDAVREREQTIGEREQSVRERELSVRERELAIKQREAIVGGHERSLNVSNSVSVPKSRALMDFHRRT